MDRAVSEGVRAWVLGLDRQWGPGCSPDGPVLRRLEAGQPPRRSGEEVKERDRRLFQEFKEFRKATTAHLDQGRRVMRALYLAVKKIDPEAKLNGEGP